MPLVQMKDPCLPVGYCFPASIPLVREDYNTHTNYFHIPQWLPLTVVPITSSLDIRTHATSGLQ